MRGLPGSGKSTWVRQNLPDAVVCSADEYFVEEDGTYRFKAENLRDAHIWCFQRFLDAVARRVSTIAVDNTNTRLWEMAPYAAVAEAEDYEAFVVYVECSVERAVADNVHGVPKNVIEKMAERYEPSLPWHKVVQIPESYRT